MNISVCITTLNEESSVGNLLDSLLLQSKKPDQIIIVDGGSNDATVEIIRHYQRKDGRIKLLVEKCSRSRGRNLGVEIAKDGIIVMTDAGCIAGRDWIKNIVSPFENTNVDVVAGFYNMVATMVPSSAYHMTGRHPVNRAMTVFMGVRPGGFDVGFLPSTRSVAFKKQIWEKVGGFPEKIGGAAEDTVFNYKLIKAGAKFSRMKNALVEWGMPGSIGDFYFKIYNYALGDAKSKIWFFPGKGFASHNIHSLIIILRYLLAMIFLIFCLFHPPLLAYWFIGLLIYLSWSFRKIYSEFGDYKLAIWGPVLQILSDIAVMSGFWSGIISKNA